MGFDAASTFSPGPGPQRQQLSSTVKESTHVFSAVPCVLQNLVATNASDEDTFLMLFNRTTVPTVGLVPAYPSVWIPAKSSGSIGEELAGGFPLSIGCVAVLSVTEDSYTAIGGAAGFFKAAIT